VFPPREAPGDLRAVVLPPPPPGSLASHLSHATVGNLLLDFRTAVRGDAALARWMAAPQLVHHGSWAYQEPSQAYGAMRVRDQFDGLLFITRTTATRPTPNARKTVANRRGI
jgi:erythromycin esterase-like protein